MCSHLPVKWCKLVRLDRASVDVEMACLAVSVIGSIGDCGLNFVAFRISWSSVVVDGAKM